MNPNSNQLDAFAVRTMEVRDAAIGFAETMLAGRASSPRAVAHAVLWKSLSEQQRKSLQHLVKEIVDYSLAETLNMIDTDNRVVLTFDGEDVTQLSDGLVGELFGNRGWTARYSKYGESTL